VSTFEGSTHHSADLTPAPPSKGRGLLLVILALLAVAGLAFGAYEHQDWKRLDDHAMDRQHAKEAAAGAIPAFTSFDYRHLDADIARSKQVLTRCFGDQYTKILQTAVPQAEMAKAIVTDVVEGAQVLDLKGDLAHVQVFFEQKAEFGDGRPTKVMPYRVLLDMKKVDGSWKVNYLDLSDAGGTQKRPC
jgi:hypothetical protein